MLMRSLVSTALPLSRRVFAMNSTSVAVMPRRLAHDIELKRAHMDDITVPCGCWQEHYDNQQRKYNVFVISSFGFFLISVIAVYTSGVFNLYVKYPHPAPRA